ncbi:MAG: hypothetical protein GOV15_00560, partial [Candidatus Diapherotrites archaeon]|nr:hypothetical protein [Candidatus Diapherotrites archaeon]
LTNPLKEHKLEPKELGLGAEEFPILNEDKKRLMDNKVFELVFPDGLKSFKHPASGVNVEVVPKPEVVSTEGSNKLRWAVLNSGVPANDAFSFWRTEVLANAMELSTLPRGHASRGDKIASLRELVWLRAHLKSKIKDL